MKRSFASAIALLLAVSFGGPALAGAYVKDGAVIHNSGSTNFSGYTIKIWSDGTAFAVHSSRDGSAIGQPVGATVPKDLARKLFRDLPEGRNHRLTVRPCMKSASFGTTTTVTWHTWTSPDLECPGGGYDMAIANDVHQVVSAVGIEGKSRHIPMLQNEPRRAPAQASPSPSSP